MEQVVDGWSGHTNCHSGLSWTKVVSAFVRGGRDEQHRARPRRAVVGGTKSSRE